MFTRLPCSRNAAAGLSAWSYARAKREERSIRRTHRAERSGGRLGAFFGKSNNGRLLIAFAVALVLHGILAAMFPSAQRRSARQQVIVAQVGIERVTPSPSPSPPPIVSRARTLGPIETHVVRSMTSGARASRESVQRPGAARPKPAVFAHVKPSWEIPVGAQGAGAGRASGAGSTGNGGSGSGAGNSGSGGGAAAAAQPCGFVEFSDPHGSSYDPQTGTDWVDIELTVRFPDGHTESLMLDYPWYYRDAAANPWSARNLDNPDFATRFQAPPPGKRADEPALVQYVIAHSTKDGLTRLRSCPSTPAR